MKAKLCRSRDGSPDPWKRISSPSLDVVFVPSETRGRTASPSAVNYISHLATLSFSHAKTTGGPRPLALPASASICCTEQRKDEPLRDGSSLATHELSAIHQHLQHPSNTPQLLMSGRLRMCEIQQTSSEAQQTVDRPDLQILAHRRSWFFVPLFCSSDIRRDPS